MVVDFLGVDCSYRAKLALGVPIGLVAGILAMTEGVTREKM
jgi:hypothetical protein